MKAVFAAALVASIAVAATAQTVPSPRTDLGLGAGDVLVRIRGIGVIPQSSSSSVSSIGGHVDVSATPAPEVDASYFFTDNLAAEIIAASTRHRITATGTALGTVPVGTTWILPPTLTLQWHFLPHGWFNPYVGVGATVAFWYDTQPAGPTITKLGLRTSIGPAIQAGADFALGGPWFANLDVKQAFFNTDARLNGGTIRAKVALNPTIIGAGLGYRF